MGLVCCVAARDRSVPSRISSEGSSRTGRYAPSWSFQWDNQGHGACEVENLTHQFSHGISRNTDLDIPGGTDVETDENSGGESPLENSRTPGWQKSLIREGTDAVSDKSMGCNYSIEMKDLAESSAVVYPSSSNPSFSMPSTSYISTSKVEFLSSQNHQPPESTPSRRAHRSPGHQLLRQISDSRIPVSEGRQSYVFSPSSNDLMGSHGGSSDGWSMRTFSELVASSQRDRWSFNSEKVTRSNSRLSASLSIDLQTCGVCLKLLTEKSSWSSQKIIPSNELSVVAVLGCGHVYHAECLENMTPEIDRYDPSCPVCTAGEKHTSKMSRKLSRIQAEIKARSNKVSRNRVMDSDLDGHSVVSECRVREGKDLKIVSSSSMRSSSLKPFLRRHFSLGWRSSSNSLSENDSTRWSRKGFWTRYHKN